MFSKVKCWDNRHQVKLLKELRFSCVKGRTWTRRIQWLQDLEGRIKLKFEDGTAYSEVMVLSTPLAQTVYDRFKAGQSIADSCSILTHKVPNSLQSRKASESEITYRA